MLFSSKTRTTTTVHRRSSSNISGSISPSPNSLQHQVKHPFVQVIMSAANLSASGDGLVTGTCGSTLTFTIVGSPPTNKDEVKFNPTSCSCAFEGPSKPEIKFSSNNLTVTCEWVPKLPGTYKIYVRYDDQEVNGSPFTCKVTGGDAESEAEVKKIKVVGKDGKNLHEGRTKLTNEITIDTRGSLIIGGLSVAMEGPSKPEVSFRKNEKDGTFILGYKPENAGEYKLHLKFNDKPVPGSPFAIKVK